MAAAAAAAANPSRGVKRELDEAFEKGGGAGTSHESGGTTSGGMEGGCSTSDQQKLGRRVSELLCLFYNEL